MRQWKDNVAVIDVVGTLNLDFHPTAIDITPDGTRAYVTELADELTVIDTASRTVAARIRTGLINPFALAISPDGAFAYPGARNSTSVVVLDTNPDSPTFHTVVARVDTGTVEESAVAISPDGSFAYVGTTSDTVQVISTANHRVVGAVRVGRSLYGIGFTNSGGFAFVGNYDSADVSVIETATHTVVATVPVADNPRWVAAR